MYTMGNKLIYFCVK